MPPPSVPQPANLTVKQMKRGIPRLRGRIADLEAFDPQIIQKRQSPEVKTLQAAIDETLVAVFGYNTIEYNRYKVAAKLDNGPIVAQRPSYFATSRHGHNVVDHNDVREVRKYLSDGKQQAILLLKQAVRGLEEEIGETSGVAATIVDDAETTAPNLSKVFVVHGHDGAPKAEVARFIEKLGFEVIILHERPNKGRTLITKFCEEAASVGFAVVLMTPDDLGKAEKAADLKHRARQNVVFELGFFIGKLGSERVAALVKGEIENPSDFDGVVYIPIDKEDWQTKLGNEMREAGYEFDWNKVMR